MLTVVTEKEPDGLPYMSKDDIKHTLTLTDDQKAALVKSLEFFEENPDFPKTDVHFSEENMILKFGVGMN